MNENEIIQHEKYLGPDYIPEKLTNREGELEQMERFLLPVHSQSNTLLLYGPTGTGKTVCTKRLLQEIEQETTADTVFLDCWEYRTKTAVFAKILIELGVPVPRKGKPVDALYEKVERQVKNRNLVVALDSVGLPDVKTGVLYSMGELTGKGLSLVLIANAMDSYEKLKSRIRSRLVPLRIQFDPYEEEEIAEILEDRAKKALRDGSYTENSIRRVAEIASDFNGNCKVALALLEISARNAERESEDKLTAKLVDQVVEKFGLHGGDED